MLNVIKKISARTAVLIVIALAASVLVSGFWWIFLAAGAVLIGLSFFPRKHGAEVLVYQGRKATENRMARADEFGVARTWDVEQIGLQARGFQNDVSGLQVYVLSVIKRFVLGQDTKTAQVRLGLLKAKLEEMKVGKEIQDLMDEFEFRGADKEIRKRTQERDVLKIEIEIEELKRKRDEILKPPKPNKEEPRRSPEEIRSEKREKVMNDIREYERRKREVQKDTSISEDSRRRQENIYDKKIEELYDELEKYI